MTNEALIRLDQRVVALESIITQLQVRVSLLEGRTDASTSKVEALNSFYSDTTSRLFEILNKVTPIDPTRTIP